MVTLVWEDPPEREPRRGTAIQMKLAEPLIELRANPTKWARLVAYVSASAATSAAAKLRKYTGKEFEFRAVRDADTGGSRLYGRFVGAGAP